METPEMIVRYVDEEMDAEERQVMEAAIAADADLASQVALYREMKEVLALRLVADAGRIGLERTLGEKRAVYFGGAVAPIRRSEAAAEAIQMEDVRPIGRGETAGTAKIVRLRRWVSGVAAAAVVIFATIMLWPSGDRLFDKFGGTQMVSGVERGEAGDSLLNAAAGLFNAGRFDQALPLLDRVVAADSTNQEALFYRGVTGLRVGSADAERLHEGAEGTAATERLHAGVTDAARRDLERVYGGQSVFRYEAAFYLALSYAQAKDLAEARVWMDRIPADAPVAGKAKALREKIQ